MRRLSKALPRALVVAFAIAMTCAASAPKNEWHLIVVAAVSSPTRLLLIGKQDAGFVRKTLKFCDDLTSDKLWGKRGTMKPS